MAEWFKAPVLKIGVSKDTVGSNPSLSVIRTNYLITQWSVPHIYIVNLLRYWISVKPAESTSSTIYTE